MLTMTTNGRRRLLGSLAGSSEADAHTVLSPLGQCLSDAIQQLNMEVPEILVIDYTILPDHLHLLLQVQQQMRNHLGTIVSRLKTRTTRLHLQQETHRVQCLAVTQQTDKREAYRQQQRLADLQNWLSNGAPIPTNGQLTNLQKEALWVMQQQTTATTTLPIQYLPPLWDEGYHDRIVMRHGQIATLRHYIARNAARLWQKQHADPALVQVRDLQLQIPLETAQTLKDLAIWCDQRRTLQTSRHSQAQPMATTYVELLGLCLRRSVEDPQPYLRFRACGNADLLSCGRPLLALRLSRSISEDEFNRSVAHVMTLCEEQGAIIVSPFLSWSEKEVLRLLRYQGQPHIVLRGEEMSWVWKPSDSPTSNHQQKMPDWYRASPMFRDLNNAETVSDFDLTLKGQLLTLSPWPERPRGQQMNKFDMEMMNAMAKALAAT